MRVPLVIMLCASVKIEPLPLYHLTVCTCSHETALKLAWPSSHFAHFIVLEFHMGNNYYFYYKVV